MPEHLRALVFILGAAVAIFWVALKPALEAGTLKEDFVRRRNLWFAVTLAAFLAHNFWLYCLVAGALVGFFGMRERNPIALYVTLVFAVPPFSVSIPGFGLINQVFELDHIRLLNLVLLVPVMLRIAQEPAHAGLRGVSAAGWFLGGYLALLGVMTLLLASVTVTMRTIFLLWLDAWVPFYVACHTLNRRGALRDLAVAFGLAGVLLAAISIIEFGKGWLLYSSLESPLGIPWAYGSYMLRGDGGALRAMASTGHSIVLGYVLVVALAFTMIFATRISETWRRYLMFGLLVGGLICSLSRGPWVGAIGMLVIALGVGRGAFSRLAKLAMWSAIAVGILLISPWSNTVIDHLPFIGTVDAANVDYRSRLIDVSLNVLSQSPIFGAWDYMLNPALEEMRQGEGIIDVVNTYLGIGMATGLTGLTLFVGALVSAAFVTIKRLNKASDDAEVMRMGRCLLGALAGVGITIATVSPINVVPTVYWLLAGTLVAFARLDAPFVANSPVAAAARFASSRTFRRARGFV